MFLNNQTKKEDSHRFTIFVVNQIELVIFLVIYNPFFLNLRDLFINTTSMSYSQPSRSNYGTNQMFTFLLTNDQTVNLPFVMPNLSATNDLYYPDYFLTFDQESSDLIKAQ